MKAQLGTSCARVAFAVVILAWLGCGEEASERLETAPEALDLPASAEPRVAGAAEPEREVLVPGAESTNDLPQVGVGRPLETEPSAEDVPRFSYLDGALAQCFQGNFVAVQGDLHSHTNNSDGYHEPSDAFQTTRNCGMSFLAVTDHSEGTNSLDEAEFAQCRNQADAATVPGAFVALCGFEVEPDRGHANVFFTNDEWGAATRDDFATRLNAYPGESVAAQINHPCTAVVDNQWGAFAYRAAIDDNMALMEFSGGGSFGCKLDEYRYLLGEGWHPAPSSNGDLHGAGYNWCDEPEHRTGFWVTGLSKGGLQDAIRQRRSFAAPQGSRIRMLADGCWMGSVVGGVTSASFFVDASHGGGLGVVHLVGNAGPLFDWDCGGQPSCSFTVDLGVGDGGYVFAYASRVDAPDSPLVAAPVWFRAAPTCVGECVPGQPATQPCGNCGSQVRRCLGSCTWSAWSECAGSGPCGPGQSEVGGCNDCGTWSRQCQGDCNWGGWSACQGSGAQEAIGCGNCGQRTVQCGLDGVASASSECMGSGPCAAGQLESADCCDCGATQRVCGSDCQWSGWSECAGPDPGGGAEACSTGLGGPCEPGLLRCVDGCRTCQPTSEGSPEVCDGADNDCNTEVDDGNPQTMGAQPPAYAATLEDLSYPHSLRPGESAMVWAEFANVGSEPWYTGEVMLATDDPSQPSLLRDPAAWPAFDVAAVLDRDVLPGGRASFVFAIALDSDQRDPVKETLRLSTASGASLQCPSAHVELAVRPALSGVGQAPPPNLPHVDAESGACGCRVLGSSDARAGGGWLALFGLAALRRRRRRARTERLVATGEARRGRWVEGGGRRPPAARTTAAWGAVAAAVGATLGVAACSSDGGGAGPGAECGPEGSSEVCYLGPASARGIGECRDGERTCRSGLWGDCVGSGLPAAEICDDEFDNDCNGAADDGCPCVAGSSRGCYDGPAASRGVGACRDGQQNCVNDVWASTCVGSVVPEAEGCDALDHDCNGVPDDDCSCTAGDTRACYTGPADTNGTGSCHAGTQMCSGPLWPTTCSDEVVPAAETCDGADDDCDGGIDGADCLVRVERFWNTGICSHQYKVGTTSADAGYVFEPGEHFYVYTTAVPGTVPLYQRSDGARHLVTLNDTEGSADGYNQTETLGYVVHHAAVAWDVAGLGVTQLCRYTTTVCSDHVLWDAGELPASGYSLEVCLGFVLGWRS